MPRDTPVFRGVASPGGKRRARLLPHVILRANPAMSVSLSGEGRRKAYTVSCVGTLGGGANCVSSKGMASFW